MLTCLSRFLCRVYLPLPNKKLSGIPWHGLLHVRYDRPRKRQAFPELLSEWASEENDCHKLSANVMETSYGPRYHPIQSFREEEEISGKFFSCFFFFFTVELSGGMILNYCCCARAKAGEGALHRYRCATEA